MKNSSDTVLQMKNSSDTVDVAQADFELRKICSPSIKIYIHIFVNPLLRISPRNIVINKYLCKAIKKVHRVPLSNEAPI